MVVWLALTLTLSPEERETPCVMSRRAIKRVACSSAETVSPSPWPKRFITKSTQRRKGAKGQWPYQEFARRREGTVWRARLDLVPLAFHMFAFASLRLGVLPRLNRPGGGESRGEGGRDFLSELFRLKCFSTPWPAQLLPNRAG